MVGKVYSNVGTGIINRLFTCERGFDRYLSWGGRTGITNETAISVLSSVWLVSRRGPKEPDLDRSFLGKKRPVSRNSYTRASIVVGTDRGMPLRTEVVFSYFGCVSLFVSVLLFQGCQKLGDQNQGFRLWFQRLQWNMKDSGSTRHERGLDTRVHGKDISQVDPETVYEHT